MDYGRDYDRSAYSVQPQEDEEEEVKIAPIMERPKEAKEVTEELPRVAPTAGNSASASSNSDSASGSAPKISTASSSIFDSLIGNALTPKGDQYAYYEYSIDMFTASKRGTHSKQYAHMH